VEKAELKKPCETCNGDGKLVLPTGPAFVKYNADGDEITHEKCKDCQGTGEKQPSDEGPELKWSDGNWSSYPSDGRAYLERMSEREDSWEIFATDEDGRVIPGHPTYSRGRPMKREEAKAWVEKNLPPRNQD